MLEIVIIIASIATISLIGLSAFKKNPKSITNRIVALLCCSWIVWTLLTYVSLHYDFLRLPIVRLTMIFVMFMIGLFFFLMRVFPDNKHQMTKVDWFFVIFTVIAGGIGATPLLFQDVIVSSSGGISPVPGPGIPVFLAYALTFLISSLVVLYRKIRRTTGMVREQLRFIALGAMVFFIVMPLTNFVLPVVFSRSDLVILSPLAPMVFSLCIGYAIVKHRLFDIRAFVVRAVVYVVMLVLLGVLYVAIVVNAGYSLLSRMGLSEYSEVYYVVATLLVAVSFHPLRQLVDRLTNRIFFQDAYDTKEVLDLISSVPTRTVAASALIEESALTLQDPLRAGYVVAVVGDAVRPGSWRSIGVGEELPNLRPLADELKQHPYQLLVADEMNGQSQRLYELMRKADVAVVARLETPKEPVGYLFFGHKESGNIYSNQDIELIRIASDELAVAIQNALRFEEIRRFNETLQEEVHDATVELRGTNRKLHQLDNAKDEFISMASHQLRTPLTTIKGYLSMVLDGDVGEITPQQRKLLEEAFNSSQRMVYLISDFLNVSRLQTGKFELELNEINLANITGQEVEQMRDSAKSRGIKIQYEAPDNFPVISIDENKIRQVIMNFIDNAIFYTLPKDTIQVSLLQQGKEVALKVTDHGIGVPASERHKLFAKFFRASNAKKQRPDGTGIGLFMARKVITAHGGSIIFETAEGKGSTFGFRLPITSPDSPAQRSAK